MKLMIGGAQFGFKYGINNKKINKSDLNKIFKILKKNNISYFDTSNEYGDSEIKLSRYKVKNKHIISKIRFPKNKKLDLDKWLNLKINKILNRLKVKKLYGLLIHNINDLNIKYIKHNIISSLFKLKLSKKVKFIGASIYTTNDAKKILNFWTPDILQIPINISNKSFVENKKIFKIFKKKKIIICARSVFLRGILLQKKLNFKNKKINKNFSNYVEWCKDNKLSQIEFCMNYIKNLDIDFMVVGFDDPTQLGEIIRVFRKKPFKLLKNFKLEDKILSDPRKWV